MARRAGIALSLEQFDQISRTVPVIANIRPSGEYLMEDFFYAGGLPALMKMLDGSLHGARLTVSGRTIAENVERRRGVQRRRDPHRSTRRSMREGATAVLRGNLAPRGAVMKPSAAEPRLRSIAARPWCSATTTTWRRRSSATTSTSRRTMCWCCRTPAPRAARACPSGACCRSRASWSGRRARHAAHLGRPHVRHELRRLHPARVAGELRRRAAGAGADRRRDRGRRGQAPAAPACLGRGAGPAPRQAWMPPAPRYERGYGRMFQEHIGQADDGCDFDFLEQAPPCPSPRSTEARFQTKAKPQAGTGPAAVDRFGCAIALVLDMNPHRSVKDDASPTEHGLQIFAVELLRAEEGSWVAHGGRWRGERCCARIVVAAMAGGVMMRRSPGSRSVSNCRPIWTWKSLFPTSVALGAPAVFLDQMRQAGRETSDRQLSPACASAPTG